MDCLGGRNQENLKKSEDRTFQNILRSVTPFLMKQRLCFIWIFLSLSVEIFRMKAQGTRGVNPTHGVKNSQYIHVNHKDLIGNVISLRHMVVNFEHKVHHSPLASVFLRLNRLLFVPFKSQDHHFGINSFIE